MNLPAVLVTVTYLGLAVGQGLSDPRLSDENLGARASMPSDEGRSPALHSDSESDPNSDPDPDSSSGADSESDSDS